MAKRKRHNRSSSEQTAFARHQRREANEFSNDVWDLVRGSRILNEKFRREYLYPPYTLDFVCLKWRLVVEIDGRYHLVEAGKQQDERRDAFLRNSGFKILRVAGFRVT